MSLRCVSVNGVLGLWLQESQERAVLVKTRTGELRLCFPPFIRSGVDWMVAIGYGVDFSSPIFPIAMYHMAHLIAEKSFMISLVSRTPHQHK